MVSSMSEDDGAKNRRGFIIAATGLAASAIASCAKHEEQPSDAPAPSALASHPELVRVVSVSTAVEGGVLPKLIDEFKKTSPLQVELTNTDQPYDLARAGRVDLAVSHYGHRDAESFVMDGFGEWPRMLFSNQMALLGPPDDPAGIRGLEDVVEAFRRIAAKKSPLLLNDIDGVRYLVEVIWNAAGRPDRAAFLVDEHIGKSDAVRAASDRGAYIFWGLTPFLRTAAASALKLEPLVLADPMLQRMLVSIVVKPKVAGVNVEGARALQTFMLTPAAQAMIRDTPYPGPTSCRWVPAGRHNRTAILPRR